MASHPTPPTQPYPPPTLSTLALELRRKIWQHTVSSGPVIAHFDTSEVPCSNPQLLGPHPDPHREFYADLDAGKLKDYMYYRPDITFISTRHLYTSSHATIGASCPSARLHTTEVHPLAHTTFNPTSFKNPNPHLFRPPPPPPPAPISPDALPTFSASGLSCTWKDKLIAACSFTNTIHVFYLSNYDTQTIIYSVAFSTISYDIQHVAFGLHRIRDFRHDFEDLADVHNWPALQSITIIVPSKILALKKSGGHWLMEGNREKSTETRQIEASHNILEQERADWLDILEKFDLNARCLNGRLDEVPVDGGVWDWEAEKGRLVECVKEIVRRAWGEEKRTNVPDVRVKVSDFGWLDYGAGEGRSD